MAAQNRYRLGACGALAALVAGFLPLLVGIGSTPAGALPPGFVEQTVISGLSEPMAVRFSPDGRVFVAEKSGLIKSFDGLADTTASIVADLRTNVYNHHDRGLMSIALHPDFPADPDLYVLYAYDAVIGGTAPRWAHRAALRIRARPRRETPPRAA